jgi:hypothetical protein
MQITLEVPDNIGQQLQQFADGLRPFAQRLRRRTVGHRLPEVLDRALQELSLEATAFTGEEQIIELLASQPSPEAVFALRPAPEMQARMSDLLDRHKSGGLSRQDEIELDRYFLLEHLVRLAKAHAYKQLQHCS